MTDRLVAVGVSQNEIVLGNHAVPHNLVRGARATQHEECPVCTEDASRIAFRIARRTDVTEPGAERRRRNAEIGAQQVLPEKPMKLLTHWMFQKRDAAHV